MFKISIYFYFNFQKTKKIFYYKFYIKNHIFKNSFESNFNFYFSSLKFMN